jgi:hypothetical protein
MEGRITTPPTMSGVKKRKAGQNRRHIDMHSGEVGGAVLLPSMSQLVQQNHHHHFHFVMHSSALHTWRSYSAFNVATGATSSSSSSLF